MNWSDDHNRDTAFHAAISAVIPGCVTFLEIIVSKKQISNFGPQLSPAAICPSYSL